MPGDKFLIGGMSGGFTAGFLDGLSLQARFSYDAGDRSAIYLGRGLKTSGFRDPQIRVAQQFDDGSGVGDLRLVGNPVHFSSRLRTYLSSRVAPSTTYDSVLCWRFSSGSPRSIYHHNSTHVVENSPDDLYQIFTLKYGGGRWGTVMARSTTLGGAFRHFVLASNDGRHWDHVLGYQDTGHPLTGLTDINSLDYDPVSGLWFVRGHFPAGGPEETLVSPDLIEWEPYSGSIPPSAQFPFDGEKYMTTGFAGSTSTRVLRWSTDGVNWTDISVPWSPRSVIYGHAGWVAVGDSPIAGVNSVGYGIPYFSSDGFTWSAANVTTTNPVIALLGTPRLGHIGVTINYFDGTYFSSSGHCTNDPSDWNRRPVTYNNSVSNNMVLTGGIMADEPDNIISQSNGGVTWVDRVVVPGGATASANPIIRFVESEDRIVAVPRRLSTNSGSHVSTDGTSWSTGGSVHGEETEIAVSDVAYSPLLGKFCAIGSELVAISSDGYEWETFGSPSFGSYANSISWLEGPNKFVVAQFDPRQWTPEFSWPWLWESSDGVSWQTLLMEDDAGVRGLGGYYTLGTAYSPKLDRYVIAVVASDFGGQTLWFVVGEDMATDASWDVAVNPTFMPYPYSKGLSLSDGVPALPPASKRLVWDKDRFKLLYTSFLNGDWSSGHYEEAKLVYAESFDGYEWDWKYVLEESEEGEPFVSHITPYEFIPNTAGQGWVVGSIGWSG